MDRPGGDAPDRVGSAPAGAGRHERDPQWYTLFQFVPVGLLVMDETAPLSIAAFNDRAADMLGYRRDEFARLSLFDIEVERSVETLLEDARRVYALPAGTRFERPLRQRCKDGAVRDLLATVLRVDEGGRRRVYSASIDITDRLRAEVALREADRRRDEFLATLAHELRNPLAPLRTGLEAMRRLAPDARMLPFIDMGARQVRHMTRLVDDLLEVSRISRGVIQLRPEPMEADRIVAAVLESLEPRLAQRGQRVELDLPEGPCRIEADPTRFAQILENLLVNASKYSHPGGRIGLRVRCADDRVTVAVTDRGLGIAAEDLERVFEMFVQADPAIERSGEGLGIGLALARRLAEAHGGTLRASSAGRGHGSTFELTLPVTPPAVPRD